MKIKDQESKEQRESREIVDETKRKENDRWESRREKKKRNHG